MYVVFTARNGSASSVLVIVILSVRLSMTSVLCDEVKELELAADILTPNKRVITLVFCHQQKLIDDVPFHLKFAIKET